MDNQQEEKENVKEIIIEKKSGFNYPEMIIIMIIALLFGFLIGNIVSFTKGGSTTSSSSYTELKELVDTYQDIVDNYYEKVDKEKLIDAGIKGMISYLDDPYAGYLEGSSSEEFNQTLNGSYQGIGIEVVKNDTTITVTKVFDNSPAFKAGFKVGDIITKVSGEDVTNLALDAVVELIKGNKTGTVDVQIMRDQKEQVLTVARDTVDIPQVSSKVYTEGQEKVGYIKLEIFSANIAKQFKNEMKKLEEENISRLIIDVRDNPGGYLTQVTEILSLFMNKKQVIYQLETKGVKEKIYGTSKKATYQYPVVVLINKESASASEILASAFKETYHSDIVGVSSYGKGTVQKTGDLNSGDTIKYTVQKWLTPKGNWINEKGVEPTKEVKLNLGINETLTDENDTQLQKAIEVICSK